MASLHSGKSLKVIFAVLLAFQTGCALFPQEKPLNPKLLFTIGSSFLDNTKALALGGNIDFNDGRSTQSGKFTVFVNGLDSLALLIEGPFNVDVFNMIIIGDNTYIHSGGEDWKILRGGEHLDVEAYGIENLSPDLTGLFTFPQYFLHSPGNEITPGEYQLEFNNNDIVIDQGQDQKGFLMMQASTRISAVYSHRKEFDGGFYPSIIKIFEPDANWQMTLHIKKLRINPPIPARIWQHR